MSNITNRKIWLSALVFLVAMACTAAGQTIYVDDNAPNDPEPNNPDISDPNEDGSPEHPFDAIQKALDVAVYGDQIHVAAGIYAEHITLINGVALIGAGDLVTVIDGISNGRVIYCSNCDPNTVLSGFLITNGTVNGIDGADGADGIDGEDGEDGENGYGGGMYCDDSNLTISNCTFSNNMATGGSGGDGGYMFPPSHDHSNGKGGNGGSGYGGGIYCINSSPTITKCIFINNTVSGGNGGRGVDSGDGFDSFPGSGGIGSGGGIYCDNNSGPTITRCTFSNNKVIGGNGGNGGYDARDGANSYGGGIYCNNSLVITNCVFYGNTVTGGKGGVTWINESGHGSNGYGGGLYCNNSQAITNCTFFDNTAKGGDGGDAVTVYPHVSNPYSNWPGNGSNGYGGGLYCNNSQAITNCTFFDNTAKGGDGGDSYSYWAGYGNGGDGYGGGLYCNNSQAITNCTLCGNMANGGEGVESGEGDTGDNGDGIGGGLFCDSGQIIANSILWGNMPNQLDGHDCANVSYCNIADSICEGMNGNISVTPCFADSSNPDPNRRDYHLLLGSPCIDAGDNNLVPAGITIDLDSKPRFIDDILTADTGKGTPPIVDMGAYEFAAYYVDANSPNDPGTGTLDDPYRRIQDAIDAAQNGYFILVASGDYNESLTIGDGNDIYLFGGYDGNDWLAPRDPNANETVIDANALNDSVVHIIDVSTVIDGFTITNGLGGANGGGGIYCENSNLVIRNCKITNNRTANGYDNWNGDGGDAGNGAGICCTSSCFLFMQNCILSYNMTGQGGWGGDGEGGVGGHGGGIYCFSAVVKDCTIVGNMTGRGGRADFGHVQEQGVGGSGAGIYCAAGSTTIQNCLIVGNMTGSGGTSNCHGSNGGAGGGIYSASSATLTVLNCNISRNKTGDGSHAFTNYHESVGGNGGSGAGILCYSGLVRNCIIAGNVTGDGGDGGDEILRSDGGDGGDGAGIFGPSVTITNCTIADNTTGLGGTGEMGGDDGSDGEGAGVYTDSNSVVTNTIIWGNSPDELLGQDCNNVTYCDIGDGNCIGSTGNISADPCFVDPDGSDNDPNTWEDNDFHLQSQFGRWDPNSKTWITDGNTSLCIDTDDPTSDWTAELWPHGKRINMGAYGGTAEASMSPSECGNIADLNHDDMVNFADFALFGNCWPLEQVLLAEDLDRNGLMDTKDLNIFCHNWLMTGDPNLVGYWKFDQTTGITAWDSSCLGNHGTLVSGPVRTGSGELLFDGADDYVEVPDSNSLDFDNEMSISVWIYLNAYVSDWPKVVIKPHSAYENPWEMYCIDLSHYGTYPRMIVTDGIASGAEAMAADSSYTLSLNQWYHIVGTYDGSLMSLYVDGQPVANQPTSIQIGQNDMPLSIGGRLGTHNSFDGLIDEVRIYNRALTEDQVEKLYESHI